MFALHKKILTRRYLFGLLDLLLCPLGFGLGVFYICKGLRKLGLFCFKLPLRRLELLAELLELFLYLAHSGLLLFALLEFQGCFGSASDNAFLRDATSVVASVTKSRCFIVSMIKFYLYFTI